MGNIFSNEEKLQREKFPSGKDSRKIIGIYEHYGYDQTNNSTGKQKEHRYVKKRNLSFHGRNGRNYYYKSKSHSLNAILEELYTFGPESDTQEGKLHFAGSKIPRIKLKRSTSSLKEEKSYKTLRKMSSDAEIFYTDATNLHKKVNGENGNVSKNTTNIIMNDEHYDEISKKSHENYFAKNFDDCMKRLELIEKEYKLIENVDTEKQFSKLSHEKDATDFVPVTEMENSCVKISQRYDSDGELKNLENGFHGQGKIHENRENEFENVEKEKNLNGVKQNSTSSATLTSNTDKSSLHQNNEIISDWYSNLKNHFEKKEEEIAELKVKEMSCRITGATLKGQNETKKPEEKETDTRHYFSNLVKTNRSLINEELPDPDKVKQIRAMFQDTLNSTLRRKLDNKLGGSLQNISFRAAKHQMARPLSAQCCRNELYCETEGAERSDDKKDVQTSPRDVSKSIRDEHKDFETEDAKRKIFEKYEKDLKTVREYRNRRMLQSKWTDTGSVSSGVGSDLSSYDTDLESYSREGPEQDEITISDDDLLEEIKDKHYIQNEVLEKIRSFGTSVTYYGGEMIACSVGPLLSPTTQAIMEEIGEKYGREANGARSFDEFYRKYIETNEHSRKKKLGRARSFGQSDLFQKPNVLSNIEIELYKDDLEIEIGIKKPAGSQNSLKKKITKSVSLGCEAKTNDNATETVSQTVVPTTDLNIANDTTEENSRKEFSEENETENKIENNHMTENTALDNNSRSDENSDEKSENINKRAEETPEEKAMGEERELKKANPEREYSRCKSAPEGLTTAKKYEMAYNNVEPPAKEIYFSYEKSLFNGKRKSDMEFEEFEVCESLSEKLEKLEKQNSENVLLEDTKSEEVNKEEKEFESIESGEVESESDKTERSENEIFSVGKTEKGEKRIEKELKFNHSRWPIETTVMVDIQKSDEQTPKIISNRKTLAKTKLIIHIKGR